MCVTLVLPAKAVTTWASHGMFYLACMEVKVLSLAPRRWHVFPSSRLPLPPDPIAPADAAASAAPGDAAAPTSALVSRTTLSQEFRYYIPRP